ncbi:MAG: type II toxin-antitoxin system HicB family antitoxin [Thermoplasmatota archaeon]
MDFYVVLEEHEERSFIPEVPTLPGCHTSGRTKEEALANVRDAIELYLEVEGNPGGRFLGVERVTVAG